MNTAFSTIDWESFFNVRLQNVYHFFLIKPAKPMIIKGVRLKILKPKAQRWLKGFATELAEIRKALDPVETFADNRGDDDSIRLYEAL